MMEFRLAAKAFIVQDGKLLMMKRRANDPHKPEALDIPGGRLELGENPLSEEHQEYSWVSLSMESGIIPEFFKTAITNYLRYETNR
jgi:hypothetical protein